MPSPYLNRRESQLRLTGQLPTLSWERFRPTEGETITFAWWCLSVCAYAVMMALFIDGFRFNPQMLFILPLLDLLRWWHRFSAGQWYLPKLSFLIAPWTLVLILTLAIPMVAYLIHPLAWWGAVICLATLLTMNLGEKIRTHYLDYALEHPGLAVGTRAKWQMLLDSDFQNRADPLPSRTLSESETEQFQQAVACLRGKGRDDALLVIAGAVTAAICIKLLQSLGSVVLRDHGSVSLCSVLIAGLAVWPVLFQCSLVGSLGASWHATWHALNVFCHSPRAVSVGARAPWSERSRYGDAENRQAYLVWNVVAITLLILSATVFYPLIGDPLRDTKLGHYPLTGSISTFRLLEVRLDRNFTATKGWLYFGAVWLFPPLFTALGLMTTVGPTAHGARQLFENDSALEHG